MKKAAALTLAIGLGILGGRLAYLQAGRLSLFKLQEIRLKCTSDIDDESIISTAGLRIGESVFEQDLRTAVANIMQMPAVRQAEITRKPFGKIEIDVQTEEPILLAKFDRLYGLTRSQKIMALAEPDLNLPILTGFQSRNPRELVTNRSAGWPDRLRMSYAISIMEQAANVSPGLAARIAEINISNLSQADIFIEPKAIKVIIPLNNIEKSFRRLARLDELNRLDEAGIIDMRGGRVISRIGDTNAER